jgi:Domain of unknown function (DUF3943)
MSHTGKKCVAVLAALMACDTAAGQVSAEHGSALESCRRAAAKLFSKRPPGCVQRLESDAAAVLERSSHGLQNLDEFMDSAGDEFLRQPDARGRRSDTLHFFAYQGVSIAILYALPESVTGWTDEQRENYSLAQWWDHVQHPKWDSDEFYLNYIAHPYWGAAYFVRSRERGYGDYDSFWYSAGLSASYEFGAEALFENPSIQDLIVTPVGGWLVGRYFMSVRDDIAAKGDVSDLPLGQRVVLTLTDPLGAINRTVDGWFGLEQRFTLQPFFVRREVRHPVEDGALRPPENEPVYGFTFTYAW